MQSASPRRDLGTIGWGTNNPKLDQGVKRRILPEMNHKKAFDFGGLKDLPQMNTMGYQSQHIDNMLGLPFEILDDMSVREQRFIIKKRVAEVRQMQAYRISHRITTKPIDTSTNKRLFIKQQEKLRTQSKLTDLSPVAQKKNNPNNSIRSRSHIPATSYTTAESTRMAFKRSMDNSDQRMSADTKTNSLF